MPRFPFADFGGGVTMSLDGGFEESDEFFFALANAGSNAAMRSDCAAKLASSLAIFASSLIQFGHP